MDKKLIDQYAFEIFSRVKLYEIEFKIFQTEERLKKIESDSPNATLTKRDFHNRVLLVKSEIGGYKRDLEKLQTQIEQFRQEKQINN
jgi:hypothetical protein